MPMRGVYASSTDYNQSIFNTVRRFDMRPKFWSSNKSEIPSSDEFLVYMISAGPVEKGDKVMGKPAVIHSVSL